MTNNIETYEDGTFPKRTGFGCYPLFYVTKKDDTLCANCANAEKHNVLCQDANWEDAFLFCDECGDRIESAYAEEEWEGAK
jgi:hypothetical protein